LKQEGFRDPGGILFLLGTIFGRKTGDFLCVVRPGEKIFSGKEKSLKNLLRQNVIQMKQEERPRKENREAESGLRNGRNGGGGRMETRRAPPGWS